MKMHQKIIAIAVMLSLQLAAGAVQAEGHKKGSAVAEHASASKANPRYVINGSEVYDKKTDLTWQRCSVGQHWKEGGGCIGIIKRFYLDDALRQANGRWRVPTVEELESLVVKKSEVGSEIIPMDEVAFPDMDVRNSYYWSSSLGITFQGEQRYTYYVFQDRGGKNDFRRLHEDLVALRLVKDGQ
jgi:hypothetical protein